MTDPPAYFWREAIWNGAHTAYCGKLVKDLNGRVFFVIEGSEARIEAGRIKHELHIKEEGRWKKAE